MSPEEIIRKHLLEIISGGNAHPDFEQVTEDFPPALINRKAPHMPYSPWHILEHMRLAQWDIVQFVQNPDHVSPDWPQGYFPLPGTKTDEAGWQRSMQQFRADRELLKKWAADRSLDLFAPIAHAREYTVYREILLAADHNAYHTGELASLRQVLNAWPPGRPLYDAEA